MPSVFAGPGSGVRQVAIPAEHAGQRIDNYLLTRLKGVPKSRIYRILRKGEVRVNKKRVAPGYRLQAGDLVLLDRSRAAAGPGRGRHRASVTHSS